MRALQYLQSSAVLESRRQLVVCNLRRNNCHICQRSRSATGIKAGFLATVSQQKPGRHGIVLARLTLRPPVVLASKHVARILVPGESYSLAHNTVHTGIAAVACLLARRKVRVPLSFLGWQPSKSALNRTKLAR